MSISLEAQSYLISGMASTPSGRNLINAIHNQSALSPLDFTRLKDALGEDDIAANLQACILGAYALSVKDVRFIKDGFSLPDSALKSVLDNLAGGLQISPASPNSPPPSAQNQYPNGYANSSPINVNMPAGFSFTVNYVGPAYQQWDAMTFPAGSTFASSGAGKYWKIFTGSNSNQYYVWYAVSGGTNSDPAPAGFIGIEVSILSSDSASAVASKTNAALNASGGAGSGNFAILAATAITNVGSSVLSGDLGISPNGSSSITGFPPGTYSGALHAADSNAAAAQVAAQASFTAKQTLGLAGTVIPSELADSARGGAPLTPGAYKFASGSAGLSLTSGHSTLTFNGAGTYIIYTATTLLTGASGSTDLPLMVLSGGATAANIYWIVGSAATINQSVSSSGAIFQGNVIASAAITAVQDGVINGSLISLNAAVNLSGASAVNDQSAGPTTGILDDASSSVSGPVVNVILFPFNAKVARPKFSKAPGSYFGTQSVSLSSATAGVTIYYTVDGSQPSALSTLYSGPISVSANETINAIAIVDDFTNSDVASARYIVL